jgi:hypothetical protein
MCSLTADGLAWMPKTPAAWNSQVQSILRTEGASGDSFSFFLQLLVIAAQSWINNSAAAKVTCKAICQMLFLHSCSKSKLVFHFGGNTGPGRGERSGILNLKSYIQFSKIRHNNKDLLRSFFSLFRFSFPYLTDRSTLCRKENQLNLETFFDVRRCRN